MCEEQESSFLAHKGVPAPLKAIELPACRSVQTSGEKGRGRDRGGTMIQRGIAIAHHAQLIRTLYCPTEVRHHAFDCRTSESILSLPT